ncbi:response regulator [Candidatus Berkiella aquae]|nr:response regulator [Candidatus Berkiella aquae]
MTRKMLIIDDDVNNLEIIEGFLRMGNFPEYQFIKCKSAEEGLKELISYCKEIDIIILDQMMPGMSGLELVTKVKADPRFSHIPIVMQTASNDKSKLVEGFRLGIYHYLTKPYLSSVFNAIIRGALDFFNHQRELSIALEHSRVLYDCIENASFTINNLEQASKMSVSLAQLFPYPEKVALGISEILVNAIEHGNLNITYEEKTELNLKSQWKQEVERRLVSEENKNKQVTIHFIKKKDEIILNVKDEGEGFDYARFLEFDPSRSTHNHGRGIAFANNISFDRLEYVGVGNQVNCIVKL